MFEFRDYVSDTITVYLESFEDFRSGIGQCEDCDAVRSSGRLLGGAVAVHC